ncbi:MAG: hypothetical protein M1833_001012 [Piccolia ochrophora]|nr:MAG: hypothetical protein M1833_001012 [Piccolia ochrophora]
MEVARGPVARSHTSTTVHSRHLDHPNSSTPLVHSQQNGHHVPSSYSQASSGTLFPSAHSSTTLVKPQAPLVNGGPVVASDNIINQVADSSRSLYQICIKLRQRLSEVPGFEHHLMEMEDDDAHDEIDPVASIWRCLRKGYPLLTVLNALNPQNPITVDETRVPEAKRAKTAAFKFVQACLQDLSFPPDECFVIMDLFGEDTTGFVKVTSVLNRVLDILQERNLLHRPIYDDGTCTSTASTQKRTRRDYVICELVDTERKYVQDLETLQKFKMLVEEKGEVPGDTIHAIFLNLNTLLDFQRRFLIRIETMNSLPESQQNWGQLFKTYHENFSVYEPYIANQKQADEQAMREFEKLQKVGHSITNDRATLSGFLLKPFQRLSKYPLLLKELRDKCEAEEHLKRDLTEGITSASSVLDRANSALDKEHRHLAVDELQARVEDWKGHDITQFGELLLYGTFIVVKGDGRNDVEREYKIYLFDRILLCCKESNPNKQKNKVMSMNKPALDKKGKPRLQLKGRIFMQNVTDLVSLQKPGSYTIQIYWRGDPGVENFVIRFANEETMKKWHAQIDVQRKHNQAVKNGARPGWGVTSDTEFTWVREQGIPSQNPYTEEAEEEEDASHENGGYGSHPDLHMSRNASSTSMRSRSTTGDSSAPLPQTSRVPPPRFPMGGVQTPALTLHTQLPHAAPSAAERGNPSYFSPTMDSPMSTRASSSMGMYPFPRQPTPNNNWPGEEHNRYTAPAYGGSQSRDAHGGNSMYHTDARSNSRPSLPPMALQNQQQAAMAQSRMRSASSPDIHNHVPPGRRVPNGQSGAPPVPEVPLPPFPSHMNHIKNLPSRSHNNSPTSAPNGVPIRAATQSPGIQRDRLTQQGHTSVPYTHEQHNRQDPRALYPSHNSTPVPTSAVDNQAVSPPRNEHLPTPTQLKVKVSFDNNYVTLVVGMNISYQSLVDRIDAKLSRFTPSSIGRGTIRLRYQDEDGDFVTIRSDEDVHMAFSDWKEQQRSQLLQGQLGEIQLYCQSIDN